MRRPIRLALLVVLAGAAVAAAGQVPAPAAKAPAAAPAAEPLFGNLPYHRPVTTSSPEAQRYFDQGLNLLYGFNHDEAIRSFAAATRLDPDCAMAWWGIAYANGIHINNPILDPDHATAAWQAVEKAVALAAKASPVEKALIAALAQRYSADPAAPRPPLDEAYARAMREVWHRFPEDADAGALYAESMMDLRPWRLWTHDQKPEPGTKEIVATLEAVLAKHPNHPGANHFYIHTMEPSAHPEKALPAAEKIAGLVPGAGHLVHMPAHIYIRVGRYEDAAEANRRAIAVDRDYERRAGEQGLYLMYVAHNYQFLSVATMMEGRSAESIQAARDMAAQVPAGAAEAMAPMVDGYLALPTLVLARFGRWQELLAEPEPPPYLPLDRAVRHFVRGLALAATGKFEGAEAESKALDAALAATPEEATWAVNSARQVLVVASALLAGELVARRGDPAAAVPLFEEAVRREDLLVYDEPPDWLLPARLALGAALLDAGRPAEAEAAYRAELAIYPEDGWSLFGLARALKQQEKTAEATAVERRFQAAWQRADVTLTASRF
jgi:tetratricopeptide (TPR) repeat protein